MDELDCTAIVAHLKAPPALRDPRGGRHLWRVILTLIAAARLVGPTSNRMTARHHRRVLARDLPLFHGETPSQSTFQRAMAMVDLDALEGWSVATSGTSTALPHRGLALDGKGLNGAVKLSHRVMQNGEMQPSRSGRRPAPLAR